MKTIKDFFKQLFTFIINPIKTVASINVSDKFIAFVSKNIWLKALLSLLISGIIFYLVYYTDIL